MGRDDFAVMVEFLRARLREDDVAAHALKPGKNQDVARLQARVLADVEAKRRLVDWVEELPRKAENSGERAFWLKVAGDLYAERSRDLRSPVIYELVLAYADHPDFHPEWLPVEEELEGEYEPGMYASSTRRRDRTT
jgi:hypothetical protein